jgi:hypothetical protein
VKKRLDSQIHIASKWHVYIAFDQRTSGPCSMLLAQATAEEDTCIYRALTANI